VDGRFKPANDPYRGLQSRAIRWIAFSEWRVSRPRQHFDA
jgi:hypothetical protein